MSYMLGKREPLAGAFPHRFSSLFDVGSLPKPWPVFGRTRFIAENAWGVNGNDVIGDCAIVGPQHEAMLQCFIGGKPIPKFTTQTAIADYQVVGNYIPGDASTDNGCYVADVAAYRKVVGIVDANGVRHKINGATSLNLDVDEIALAAFTFGAAGIGLNIPESAMTQFDNGEPWDVVSGSASRILGRHYVPLVGRNIGAQYLVVTWGRIHAVTRAFLERYLDEAQAYLDFTQLRDGVSQRHYDQAGLEAAFGKI